MRSTLGANLPAPPEIYSEYLDAVRTSLDDYESDLVRQLQIKFRDKNFDLIFAVNPPALKFLLKNRSALSPGTPIAFLVLDQQNISDIDFGPNVTGVWGEVNYRSNLELALKLQPGTKHVVVISGVGEWDNYWRSVVQELLRPFETHVDISYLTGLTIPEQKDALSTLPNNTIVLFVSSTQDKAGNNPGNLEVIRQISPASSAPIYGSSDAQLGLGIVGGQLTSFEALGIEGAQTGLRVLAGEKPEAIAPHGVSSRPMFDWRQLQRWGISEASLPEGSVVRFKQPTVWEEYRWYAIGLLGVLTVETMLIGFLIYLRIRRRQAEAEAERLSGRITEIVANVPGIVWETKTDPATKKRRTTFISNYVQTMLGYSPSEWMKQPQGFGFRIVADEDRERAKRDSEAVIESGEGGVSEFRWLTKDGGIRWIENHLVPVKENGNVVGMRGVALDVTNRKLAEEKARQTDERNTAIVTAIPDLIFVVSKEGVYIDYHANNVDELLVPPEIFLGKNVRDVLPPEVAEEILKSIERASRDSKPQVVDFKLSIEGRDIWYESRLVRSGENFLSVVRDTTERKEAEAERSFQARMLNTFEQAAIATDLDGVVFYWNAFAEKIYGWPAEEAVGRNLKDLFESNNSPEQREKIWSQLRDGQSWIGEFALTLRDRSVIQVWVNNSPIYNDDGKLIGILGISHDITERKAAEEALRESEERLRLAQHAARVGTWEWEISTGDCVWSEMVWELLGLEPGDGEATVDRYEALIHPDDRERSIRKAREVIAEGDEYYDEFRIVRADGSMLWISSKGRVLRSEDGLAQRIIGVNIDITERKAADEALREREERFRDMAETAPVAIWMSDENQCTTYISKQWRELTGSTLEDNLGFGWSNLIHPEDIDFLSEKYTAAFEMRIPFEVEFRVRREDGEFRWMLAVGTPRSTGEGAFLGYIGSAIDITDRKQSERALQEAHEELHKLKDQLEAENIYLQEELRQDQAFGDIVGQSAAIKYVLFKIQQVAPTDSTVLITGETGTGKELVAHAIHQASLRKDRPLIKVNCAALSPSLIESELFGHEKGAFTGAGARRLGRFELASSGTLFLDEIGELPLDLQGKLLRVIQEGEFERVGSGKTITTDVRIIASTNRNLKKSVEEGKFREDLWYRLNVFPITTPPLRERRDDIPILTEYFARKFARKLGKTIEAVAPDSMSELAGYSWPGNVRELANVIERAVINSRGRVLRIREDLSTKEAEPPNVSVKTLEELERDHIVQVLEDLHWKIDGPNGAARRLGINPSTLRSRITKLEIKKPDGKHSIPSSQIH